MAIYKEFQNEDIQTGRSYLNQIVDIVSTDISSSQTRRKYEVWVTGSSGSPGVTSSLFQTIYDQDFTLQTANPIFDMTFGFHADSAIVASATPTIDTNGKYIFPASTIQMREKMDIYRLHAQSLLGSADAIFTAATSTEASSVEMKEALFFDFKRLFSRDQIKRETFAIKVNTVHSGAMTGSTSTVPKIYTDVNSITNKAYEFGGQVSTIVDSADTSTPYGLLFIDKGILVLDLSRSFNMQNTAQTYLTGVIANATSSTGLTTFTGSMKSLMISASIDDFIDYMAQTRFSGTNQTNIAFQNVTNINSTIYFSRLTADEFNYSSNPTAQDDGRIVVIDPGQEETQQTFTFITTVGLYDAFNNLLAVAKLSRPVLKDSERDLTLKIRLDYDFRKNKLKLNKKTRSMLFSINSTK